MYVRKQSICRDDEQINRQDQVLKTARAMYTLFLTTHRLPGVYGKPSARSFKLHKGIRRLCKSKRRMTLPEQSLFPSLLPSPKRTLALQPRSRCQARRYIPRSSDLHSPRKRYPRPTTRRASNHTPLHPPKKAQKRTAAHTSS